MFERAGVCNAQSCSCGRPCTIAPNDSSAAAVVHSIVATSAEFLNRRAKRKAQVWPPDLQVLRELLTESLKNFSAKGGPPSLRVAPPLLDVIQRLRHLFQYVSIRLRIKLYIMDM